MDTVNKIAEGLHLDFNPIDQPDNTMRDNRNGIIMDLEDGNHMWTNLEGTRLIFTLNAQDNVMASCWIRERLFMIVFNNVENYVVIYEALVDEEGDFTTLENRWEGENTELNLSLDYPIRAIFGYYENDNNQRIYWTDWNNPPRVINVKDLTRVTIEEKFANFFPIMEPVYGTFEFESLASGGNCNAGSYFFAWRLFKEGYYTDWSYLTTPVIVYPGSEGTFFDDYQDLQGGAPDENSNKRIRISLHDLDTDYDSIQIASFYSNAYNSSQPGFVFYDGDITGTDMQVDLRGNENLGTVTIDELMETSIVIEKCRDMTHIKKRIVPANLQEREELDVSGAHTEAKNNQMQVSMTPISHPLMLDSRGYPDETYGIGTKALSGIQSATWEILTYELIPGLWYQAITECVFDDGGLGTRTIPAGDVFQLSDSTSSVSLTSGSCQMVIVKRKYLPSANPGTDINDYELEIIPITGYYNFKNPHFCNHVKGYPRGETARFAILFFDKTGRPYYARHLYNTEVNYGGAWDTGPGDFTFGGPDGLLSPTLQKTHQVYESLGSDMWQFIIGYSLGVRISNINITDIADKIGGFAIVRAPMERQRIAYGAINGMTADGTSDNDIRAKQSFRGFLNDGYHYEKGYSFFCPEDIFELEGFVIDIGDKIKNEYYLDLQNPSETEYTDFQGYGRRESDTSYCFYNKAAGYNTTDGTGEGAKGVEHDVSFYTRYKLGDATDSEGIVIDPSAPEKLFFDETMSNIDSNSRRSHAAYQGIIIFDDLDGFGTDIKGKFDLPDSTPQVLMCSVFRENNNLYGGLGDSALANTLYIGTGHYQPITDDILLDIQSGNDYIFNGIEIYGGDSYVCMFDVMTLLQNEDREGSIDMINHSLIVPIETRVNLDMREGNHIAKDRSYGSANTVGIRRDSANGHRWEDFNYNDGYSSENIQDYYLPVPYNFKFENQYDTRMRYSPQKSYGELEDSFRKFESGSLIDIATEYGAITNIRAKFNRIIYWQRDAIGYIPINERALSANQFGDPVQLGVGGIFERHDELISMLGNSNQFGLIESPQGFHWYDAVRKVFVTLDNRLALDQESIVRGLDRFFVNDIPNNMDLWDFTYPNREYGIAGGFDIRHKMVFVTFRLPAPEGGGDPVFETIGYNIKKNKFIGFYDFKSRGYFIWKDYLYSFSDSRDRIYQHGLGTPGDFHGESNPAYFTIIVKNDKALPMVFDNFEYLGSEQTFDTLIYEDQLGNSISESTDGNRNLKYRNKRYYGNFPKIDRERINGDYIKFTFYYDGDLEVAFNQVRSYFRKML